MTAPSTVDNEAIYQSFVEDVLNAKNVEAAENFFAASFIDHSLPPDIPATLEGFKDWYKMFAAAFPDARWDLDVIFSYGDLVARQQSVRATHTGEFMSMPPTGRTINVAEAGIVRFEGGRMVEFWGVFDEARLMQQLG